MAIGMAASLHRSENLVDELVPGGKVSIEQNHDRIHGAPIVSAATQSAVVAA